MSKYYEPKAICVEHGSAEYVNVRNLWSEHGYLSIKFAEDVIESWCDTFNVIVSYIEEHDDDDDSYINYLQVSNKMPLLGLHINKKGDN